MKILGALNENSKVNSRGSKSPEKISGSTSGRHKNGLVDLTGPTGRKLSGTWLRSSPSRTSPTKPRSEKELSKELRPRSSPSKIASHKCQHCVFSCNKKPELILHLKSKHKKTARPATLTSKALVDAMADNFNSGIPAKSGQADGVALKCRHCQFCAKTSSDLRNHFRSKHSSDEENFPDNGSRSDDIKWCQFCSAKFDCFKSLKVHVRKRHRDHLKYKCNMCNFASNFHAGLAYHVKTKHIDDDVDKDIVVKSDFVVDEIFDEKSSVSSDGRREVSSLSCHQCDFVARSASQLDRHIKSKHSKSNSRENSFVRDEVADPDSSTDDETPAKNVLTPKFKGSARRSNNGASRKDVADTAIAVVGSGGKFRCGSCGYVAKTRSTLKCHVKRVHLGIRDQVCKQCSYRTGNKSDLTKHIKGVHLKTKDFKCDKCDYRSALSSTMVQHVKAVHLKIKNHACPKCDYKTSFRGDLFKHVRSKHSEESTAILKKLKQKKSGSSKVVKNVAVQESRSGRGDGQLHIPEDNSAAIKSCQLCDFSCRFKKSLQQHLRRKHPGAQQQVKNDISEAKDSLMACPHCTFKSGNHGILEKHISKKHNKSLANGFNEPEGKNASRKASSGDSNVRSEFSEFRCPGCDFKASKFILVAQHVRKSHQKKSAELLKQLKTIKRFACPECPLKSRFKVNIERHLSKLHPGSRSKAVMVEATSNKKEGKTVNVNKECNTKDEILADLPPSKKVKAAKRIGENRQSPENDLMVADSSKSSAQLSCSKCPFVAKSHPDLISHFDKAHLKRGSDRRCPHCGYKTTLSVLLNSHVVTSHSKNSTPKNSSFNIWHLFG